MYTGKFYYTQLERLVATLEIDSSVDKGLDIAKNIETISAGLPNGQKITQHYCEQLVSRYNSVCQPDLGDPLSKSERKAFAGFSTLA